MKCILHIGTEKTGTSVLQEWLYSNEAILKSYDVYISSKIGYPNNRLLPAFFANELDDWAQSEKINTIENKEKFFENFLKNLEKEISEASKKYKYFIISSEHFHSRLKTSEEITSLHNFLDQQFKSTEVVCYFRNQHDTAVSLYSTSLKERNTSSLNYFLEQVNEQSHYYNYAVIADLWSDIFGKNNCNFRIYDRKILVEKDIRKDFITILHKKVDVNKFNYTENFKNESLFAMEASAFRAINEFIPTWLDMNRGRNKKNIKAKQIFSNIKSLKQGVLQSNHYKDVQAKFDASNEYFFKTYFNSSNFFNSNLERDEGIINEKISLDEVQKTINDVFGALFSIDKNYKNEKISLDEVQNFVNDVYDALFSMEKNYVVNKPKLNEVDINFIRDLAIKLDNDGNNYIDDSIKLMSIASEIRPSGDLIKLKLKEFKQKKTINK